MNTPGLIIRILGDSAADGDPAVRAWAHSSDPASLPVFNNQDFIRAWTVRRARAGGAPKRIRKTTVAAEATAAA